MKKCFVLVHLGIDFFDYINDCIEQIRKFNDSKIYIVTDEQHQEKLRNKKDVEIINVHQLPKSKNHIIFDETNKLDTSFRNGFYRFTTERFLYLEDLISSHDLENVIHLENDTLVYFNYEDNINSFQENYEIATVFDNDIRAIPCLVYIKNKEIISKFNSFICGYTNKSDMELFSEYRNKINKKITLPILPLNYFIELKSKLGHTTTDKTQYFNNFDKFKSIFDGAAIGQYIGGIDPRNNPKNSIGFENESSLFKPSSLNVFFKKDNMGRNVPYINCNGENYKINNLHIHSKNLKKYLS